MRCCVLLLALLGCDRTPTPEQIAEAGWAATDEVVLAGERAKSCAEAGGAMRTAARAHHAAFVAAIQLDHDKAHLERAAAWMETRAQRYRDLETRMTALEERCGDDPVVRRVFEYMEDPTGVAIPWYGSDSP